MTKTQINQFLLKIVKLNQAGEKLFLLQEKHLLVNNLENKKKKVFILGGAKKTDGDLLGGKKVPTRDRRSLLTKGLTSEKSSSGIDENEEFNAEDDNDYENELKNQVN